MNEPIKKDIRPCLVSGLFYPDSEDELRQQLDRDIQNFAPGKASLIMTPHGSYNTNGQCMAAAIAACRKKQATTVLLLGPVHREKNNAALYLPSKNYFANPLGPIPVNQSIREKLLNGSPLFLKDDVPHMEEHCLEVQLPFIHYLFPEAEIVPILMGKLNRQQLRKAADLLKKVLKDRWEDTLTVLTVNLSDFLPLEESKRLADNLIGLLQFPLQQSLIEEERNGTICTCGTRVLTLASELFPRAGKTHLLQRQHTRVPDHGVEKGVYYGGCAWEGNP